MTGHDEPQPGSATSQSPPGTGTISNERMLGAQLFNEVGRLLELSERSQAEDDRMLHAAHASRYHWGQAPDATTVNIVRGEWQVSHVYAVLGRAEPALFHARRVLDICQSAGIGDWELAFGYEALARGLVVAGNAAGARDAVRQAVRTAAGIAKDRDRELLFGDLATIPGAAGWLEEEQARPL